MKRERKYRVGDVVERNQATASDPTLSAWVSANAGSGKTTVLTRRVLRLLLAGTPPSRILCITFTKAAAAEMETRIFRDLAKWVRLPDKDLREALDDALGRGPKPAELARARTLFARALDTPGGLNIQTIHAFCNGLLQRFPLEANVPGAFEVMEDTSTLLATVQRQIIGAAHREPGSPLGQALADILRIGGEAGLDRAMGEAVSRREALRTLLDAHGGAERATAAALEAHGFAPDDDAASLAQGLLDGRTIAGDGWNAIVAERRKEKGSGSIAFVERAETFANEADPLARLALWEGFFLKKDGVLADRNLAVAGVEDRLPGTIDAMRAEGERLMEAKGRRATFDAIHRTHPLLVLIEDLLARYDAAKRRQGVLDNDDLIARTAELLTRGHARDWILYKLDHGIDHVAVDEAQDTSPRQWSIVNAITDAFFDGAGAREKKRTMFAVGDEKQSIYSFQGAAPELFRAQQDSYAAQLKGVGDALHDVPLDTSFRSTADVLSAVDRVFVDDPDHLPHVAARVRPHGEVEIWPMVIGEKGETPDAWHEPASGDATDAAAILAERIRRRIEGWVTGGERLRADGHPIGYGDILVLVRNRKPLIERLTRELKETGVPVAGADRLDVGSHIASLDLLVAGRTVTVEDDDLSLAALMRSPLLDVDDETLHRLARHGVVTEGGRARRVASLRDALIDAADGAVEDVAPEIAQTVLDRLTRWRERATRLPVFEFFARLLGEDGGRARFAARLGPEVHDVLDAFLDLALDHERSGTPGLQPFLHEFAGLEREIKRELDRTPGAVRIMTVHAAKGLEAPVVFLVDGCTKPFTKQRAPVLVIEGGVCLWRAPDTAECPPIADHLAALEEQAKAEHRRLLYVGMTRAEDRLVLCGHGTPSMADPDKRPQPAWHAMVDAALPAEERVAVEGFGEVWSLDPDAPMGETRHGGEAPAAVRTRADLPGWTRQRMAQPPELPRPLSPSGGRALIEETLMPAPQRPSIVARNEASPPDAAAHARARGTAIHRLFEIVPDLPGETRWSVAADWLARTLGRADDEARATMLAGVRAIIEDPALSAWFEPATSRAEVSLTGTVDLAGGPRTVAGSVDRIAVMDDHVQIIDFKTDGLAPDGPGDVGEGYVMQLALYRHLAQAIWPDRTVEACLVYTHARNAPRIIRLPTAAMDAAMALIAGA